MSDVFLRVILVIALVIKRRF